MLGKIALEEHFALEETLGDSQAYMPGWHRLRARLLDIHDERLRLMDQFGIERMLVSLNAPAVQGIPDARRAMEIARRANDCLAQQIARRRTVFRDSPPCRCRTRKQPLKNCSARCGIWDS